MLEHACTVTVRLFNLGAVGFRNLSEHPLACACVHEICLGNKCEKERPEFASFGGASCIWGDYFEGHTCGKSGLNFPDQESA